MNKKGFTLMELLAVIIILSLLALLASTSVTKIVKDSKSDLYNTQLLLIKSAAEAWGAYNLYLLPESGECKYMKLKDLKTYGLLDSSIKDPRTNKEFSDDLNIKISTKRNSANIDITTYEVDVENVDGCILINPCKPVASDTVTTGNVPEGNLSIGDEYICEVKSGVSHRFFVLSTEGNRVNLIMEKNINSDGTEATSAVTQANAVNGVYSLTPWTSAADYNTATAGNTSCSDSACNDVGPITAMTYLSNATSSWINIPTFTTSYDDAEGGNRYKMQFEGRTRLPKASEIPSYDATNQTNLWAYNYLDSNGIWGYWTASTYASNDINVLFVYYEKNIENEGAFIENKHCGIRPVISLSKSNIW